MSYSSSTTIIGSVSTIPPVANIGSLPATVSDGTLRWVDSDSSIYVYNGTGWARLSSEYTLDAKQAVDYATAAALPAVTYDNGPSGVGATLAADANGALSVDGASPTVGQRILVKDQAATLQNGIYEVTATGDGSNPFVLTRTTDFDGSDEVDGGEFVYVRAGSTLAQTGWQQTAVTPTIGTDPIVWAQISGGGGGGTVTLQDAYDDTGTIELFPGFFAKTMEADTNSMVFLAPSNPAFPIGQYIFTTAPATGGANTQIVSVVNQSTIHSAMSVSNETGSVSSNLFYAGNSGAILSAHSIFQNTSTGSSSGILASQNSGTVAGYISLIEADDGSTNSGQAFLVIQNLDTTSGNDVPLIRLNHLAYGGTGDAVDIQFTPRFVDPTNLVDGGLWYNTTDNALKSSDGTGLFRVITAEESQPLGPLTVDKHTINRPLVFAASAQAVPTGSTIFYNDVADANSIPLAVINNAAAGFGAIWDNLTGASLTVLSQFQNTGTVNAAGAVVAIQSQDGSTNNGQALLVVQNQDSLGGNDVPLIKLNHLAGTGTGDAVDIQFTARTADPTTLVDGGLWFNTTDNQMKFSDGTAVYPLAHLEDGTNRGSLNLPVLAADPSAPSDGDVWLFDNGGVRAIRARMGGTTYGVALT